MTPVEVLDRVWALGASVRVEGETVWLYPPKGGELPPELIDAARAVKADLRELVSAFDAERRSRFVRWPGLRRTCPTCGAPPGRPCFRLPPRRPS